MRGAKGNVLFVYRCGAASCHTLKQTAYSYDLLLIAVFFYT